MEQIGWSLVDNNGSEVQSWGDTAGQCAGMPNPIYLPNGDHIHAPQPGTLGAWKLVERHLTYGGTPDTTYDGSKITVTRPLADYTKALKERLVADAETCRLRFISPGAGQAMTYLEKHNQANAVHEMGQGPANALTETEYLSMFPTLAASVGVEVSTLWDAALLVIARYEAWATISFVIERTRLAGLRAISNASDAAAARAAYEAITWPSP